MAKALNDEMVANIRLLITTITQLEDTSTDFGKLERQIVTTLKKSDSMYFLTLKDIELAIERMCEKFRFHSFFKHAKALKQALEKYIDRNLLESDLTPRLNVIKFLLCMSERPTEQFWKNPEKFDFLDVHEEELLVEDWGAYLNEGIERWSPWQDDSVEWSDFEDEDAPASPQPVEKAPSVPLIVSTPVEAPLYDFKHCRMELQKTIQHGWFNGKVICMEPPSHWFDANVGLLWQRHLQKQVMHLMEIEPITVISEYKVLREVLWQMWGPHNSTIFQLKQNELVVKANVTIASTRAFAFEAFISGFIPHIELLDNFREFHRSLFTQNCGETLKGYGSEIHEITKAVFVQLTAIEEEIRRQETTMTLLKLANHLEGLFENLHVLWGIHCDVIVSINREQPPVLVSLNLLTKLRSDLQLSLNKQEQDLRLALYLASLRFFLKIVDAWLVKNYLPEWTEEFFITQQLQLRENVVDFAKVDGIIRILTEEVVEIGRNIHFLRELGKFDVFVKSAETIDEEFIRRFIKELEAFYSGRRDQQQQQQQQQSGKNEGEVEVETSVVCTLDVSDGLLVKAFEDFFTPPSPKPPPPETLYAKIANITTHLYPIQEQPEMILMQILKERFTISGLMVKTILIESYNLDKQFDFFNHLFLYVDDLIFPFYRRLFENMSLAHSNWGNHVWLTSNLQDIFMDLYPNFYENCRVQVGNHWSKCRDSLEACNLIHVEYEVKWPINIIVTMEQVNIYREIFQFLLKIKWALHTVNCLSFQDLGVKSGLVASAKKRLKILRFYLVNIFNTIQHYFCGFVYNKCHNEFVLNFEKSNDLKSLIRAHQVFIQSIHENVRELRDTESSHNGFTMLLNCVKMLKVMWNETQYVNDDNLKKCYRNYQIASDIINSTVNKFFICF